MKLQCGRCGKWHTLSPTAMGIVIVAFTNGDLHEVTNSGVVPKCVGDAFTSITMNDLVKTFTNKNVITYDGRTWSLNTGQWI